MIIRYAFFKANPGFPLKEPKRSFDESQRIEIYRKYKGLCRQHLKEGSE